MFTNVNIQNPSGRPVFSPDLATLFSAGVGLGSVFSFCFSLKCGTNYEMVSAIGGAIQFSVTGFGKFAATQLDLFKGKML